MSPIQILLAVTHVGSGAAVLLLSLPLLLAKVPPNRWYGVRLPETSASEAAWYAANRTAARWLIAWSLVTLALGGVCLVMPLEDHPWRTAALAFAPGILILVVLLVIYRRLRGS